MRNILSSTGRLMCALGPFAAILLFASCQKGIDWNTPDTSGSSGNVSGNGDLLVKSVTITGKDSSTTLYTYDTAKRVSTIATSAITAGFRTYNYAKYLREPSGRIYKIVHFLDQFGGMGGDSSYHLVHYPNASSLNFDYTIHEMSVGGFPASVDSSVYRYDTSGKINSQHSYLSMPLMSPGTMLETKFEYFYSGGNLTEMKTYSDTRSTGTLDLNLHYKYTYDTKLNSLLLGKEAILTGNNAAFSTNNMVSMAMTDVNTPSNSITLTTTPVYGSNNKPVSCSIVNKPSGAITKVVFYYQ